jgi:hypothetical protein
MNLEEITSEITRLAKLAPSKENLASIAALHADRYVMATNSPLPGWIIEVLIVCHSDALRSALIARVQDPDGTTKCPDSSPHSPHQWWYGANPLVRARCKGVHRW